MGRIQSAGLPTITEVPRGLDIGRGSNALFQRHSFRRCAAIVPMVFQWRGDRGATNRTFAVTSAQFSDAGSYTVRVANNHGSVLSAAAVLLVQAPPSILVPPQSQTVVAGSTAALHVSAAGSSLLS